MTYIHIGCGFDVGEGWHNYDASPTLRFERLPAVGKLYKKNDVRFPDAVQYGDITTGPLSPLGVARGIYSSHMLEHLSQNDAIAALRHMHEMLAPDGILRIVVPDLESRARFYLDQLGSGTADAADDFMNGTHLGLERRPSSVLRRAQLMLGNSQHLWMYDERSLTAILASTGFTAVRRCRYGDCEDPMFERVENEDRFRWERGEELAVEARK